MIADMEQVERTVGTEEQARAIEAGPERLGNEPVRIARKARVKLVRQTLETRCSELEADKIGIRKRGARVAGNADHVQHRRIARPQQRANRKRGGQGLGSRYLAIKAL